MEPNPRIPSRLGCGGLLLLLLGMLHTPELGVPFYPDMTQAGLVMGKEHYATGEIWWLVGPLGVISAIAVARIAYGHRDWLAVVAAGVWLVIAAWYAGTTGQTQFLVVTALIFVLIASGTWTDRRRMESSD